MNRLNAVQICCENGINPNLQSSAGNTAVHTAAMMGKPEILEELLKHGGDPCMKNDGGETSLHLAIRHDRIKCFQIIMRNTPFSEPDRGEGALLRGFLLCTWAAGSDPRRP